MDPHPKPMPSETLRNQLLDAAAERSPRHSQYQQEVNSMFSAYEARVRKERWRVGAVWIFLVALTMGFMFIGGYHIVGGNPVDKSALSLWFCIQAVFWLLFGIVTFLSFRFDQLKLDLLTEIKRVELAILELKESQGKTPPSTTGQ